MRVPDWWPEFLTLRPRSAYQSQENPIQVERLPDTEGVELDLPTRRHTPEENRSYVRRFLWFLSFLGIGIGLYETTFSTRLAPDVAENWIFLAALTVFLYYDAAISRRHWLFVPLLLIYGFLVLSLTRSRHEELTKPFIFLLATICAVRLAGRICHLSLYLLTTAPTTKESASRQRRAWRWRYLIPFVSGPRGLEFYGVGLLIALLPAVIFYVVQPTNSALPGALLILSTLGALCLLPLLLEFCGSYFVSRPRIALSRMWRGTWYAIGEWFTYDRHDSKAPGVFKSPLGTHKQRWRMAFATVVMLTVAIAQYTGWWRAIFERWDNENVAKAEAAGERPEPTLFVLQLRDVRLDLTPIVKLPATESEFIDAADHHYLTTLPTVEQAEVRSSHDFQWRFTPEEAEQWEEYQRRAQESERAQRVLRNQFGGGEPTGSYVEDQKNQDKSMEFLSLAFLHSMLVWFYPVAATALVPSWLFFAYVFAVSGRFAGLRLRESSIGDPPELANAKNWEQIVTRVRASEDKDEKESVFVGVNAFDHSPVLVPSDVFCEHAHILGDSGSGKTALGIAPLMTQLLRFDRYSIVVIDLKADEMSLFVTAREEAEKAQERMQAEDREAGRDPRKYPYRWFTTELGKSTYAFNPLRQEAFRSLSLSQQTDVLTASLGVQYGTD